MWICSQVGMAPMPHMADQLLSFLSSFSSLTLTSGHFKTNHCVVFHVLLCSSKTFSLSPKETLLPLSRSQPLLSADSKFQLSHSEKTQSMSQWGAPEPHCSPNPRTHWLSFLLTPLWDKLWEEWALCGHNSFSQLRKSVATLAKWSDMSRPLTSFSETSGS